MGKDEETTERGRCGLRPVEAIGAYAPEGMRKKKMKSNGEGVTGEREMGRLEQPVFWFGDHIDQVS